ncbi:hypothetical protein WJX73_008648 [Symbiochloris irregularis]|uniref:Hexosyltransferase n=1 Tax=Symbiochloris irregularis TaxID=706552 RepID=A0AAW1PIS2_9CHLO
MKSGTRNDTVNFKPGPSLRRSVAVAFILASAGRTGGTQAAAQTTKLAVEDGAFATLLYQEEFVVGARVLAYSLKATGTDRDLVLLCTENISKQAQAALTSDGWDVRIVRPIANPGQWTSQSGGRKGKSFPSKFWAVYTKLYLFNMTEYRKVVFLDADTLVLQDLEGLFACPGLCAVTRHAEKVNTGVLVITPSNKLYQELVTAAPVTSSYTGGDQGFLNSFFPAFAAAPMFDPETTAASAIGEPSSLHRLPTACNADLGLYMIGGHSWTIPRSSIRVMHFTLGPIKPWQWWAAWIADECATWQYTRSQLHLRDVSRGITYGKGTRTLAKWVLFPTPVALAGLAMFFRVRTAKRSTKRDRVPVLGSIDAAGGHAQSKRPGGIQAIAAGFLAVCMGLAVSIAIIPVGLPAIWGWVLTYEWTLLGVLGCAFAVDENLEDFMS